MEPTLLAFLLGPTVVLPLAPAPAQGGCQPSWVPTFGAPGLNEAGAAAAVYDDGGGPALHAGGWFTSAGGVPANHVAKWDGTSWSPVGGGVEGGIHALTTFDHPWGRALYAGGGFTRAYDSLDRTLARWQGCLDVVSPAIHCPANLLVHEPPGSSPGESVSSSVTASDEVDPAPTLVCVPPSGSFFPRGRTTVLCTATDAAGNQATCEFRVTVANKLR